MFTRYHFNALAKEIREQMFPPVMLYDAGENKRVMLANNAALTDLAISLAKRFVKEREGEDNYEFDPLKWLDACSPDPEHMPLSELWEEADEGSS